MDNITCNCPACNEQMHQVKVSSTYGAQIFLQQCKTCGGLWCDDLDAYQVKLGEAETIDDIDTNKLRENVVFAQKILQCPNDQQVLTPFEDSKFPGNLHIENCSQCGGFWFNRGEFAEFQEERQKFIQKQDTSKTDISAEDKKLNSQIELLLSKNSPDSIDTIGTIGEFLSTPINPMTNRPFDTKSENGRNAQGAINIATGIMQIIMRCMLP